MLPDCKPVHFLQSLCAPAGESQVASNAGVADSCLAIIADVATEEHLTRFDVDTLTSLFKELSDNIAVTREIVAQAARDCPKECGICKAVATDLNWN